MRNKRTPRQAAATRARARRTTSLRTNHRRRQARGGTTAPSPQYPRRRHHRTGASSGAEAPRRQWAPESCLRARVAEWSVTRCTPPKAQSRARRTGQREPRLHGEFAKSALVEHSRPHVGHGWSGASPRPANARVNILAAQEAPARANSDLPAGRDPREKGSGPDEPRFAQRRDRHGARPRAPRPEPGARREPPLASPAGTALRFCARRPLRNR